ncbi:MAG: AAA family ATPase [Microthrixaceae bacterium]
MVQPTDREGVAPAEVAETHTSWVFLAGDRALKLLKPLRTPFLDYSTPELRHAACEAEVALNRRLAPDVYLGVSPLLEHGEPADWMVVMRRLPADRRLSTLAGTPGFDDHVREVARAVAVFHSGLEPVRDEPGTTAAGLLEGWEREVRECRTGPSGPFLDPGSLDEVLDRARDTLAGRAGLLAARAEAGLVVDGHGDLLADDIFCLPDGPRILDCLAFRRELRVGDVLADLAFLVMDLERLPGGTEAARVLVDAYVEFTGHHHPPSLLHLFVAQRALVRAKVRGLRAAQGDDPAAATDAESFLDRAVRHARAATVRLVLVGGPPGSGKSTVARALGDALDAAVLGTDELRDAVVPPGDPERYSRTATAGVYRELRRRAGDLLAAGTSVVLDATWTDATERAAARSLAARHHTTLEELRCVLDPAVAARRVATRQASPRPGPSEATPEVARRLAAAAEPWPEATTLDTTDPAAEVATTALAVLAEVPLAYAGR